MEKNELVLDNALFLKFHAGIVVIIASDNELKMVSILPLRICGRTKEELGPPPRKKS